MDELSRIEANFGCVAEYNRVMDEERSYRYAPSAKELFDRELDSYLWQQRQTLLDKKPSELAKALHAEHMASKLDYSKDYYAAQTQYKEYSLMCVEKLSALYGVISQDGGFYRPEKGKLAVEIEYVEFAEIKTKVMPNISYDTFKSLFSDLKECGLNPHVAFWFGDRLQTRGYCRLGELRISDFKYAGFETDETLKKALEEAGYDEDALTAEYTATHPFKDFEERAAELKKEVEEHNRYVDRFYR